MAVKIRLQRKGKKGKPYFHIVVADARAPRDGRYIERLGMYNPTTNPATIEIDVDSAAAWLNKGAQPTDTARAILSYRGVLYRNHLNRGVLKGAFSQEDADKKFEAWVAEKDAKIEASKERLANESASDRKARLEAEAEVNKKRAAEIAAKNAPEVVEEAAPAASEETTEAAEVAEAKEAETAAPAGEQPSEEVKAEAKAEEPKPIEEPVAETAKEAAVVEDKVEEAKEEPKAEDAAEEPKAEAKEDEKKD